MNFPPSPKIMYIFLTHNDVFRPIKNNFEIPELVLSPSCELDELDDCFSSIKYFYFLVDKNCL